MHRENGYHGDTGEISWKGEQNPKSSAVRQQKQKGFDSVILWYIFYHFSKTDLSRNKGDGCREKQGTGK